MPTLTLSPVDVSITERGATVSFMGGSLWLRPELCSGLRAGPMSSIALDVSLRRVSAGERVYDAIMVQGVRRESAK